MSADKSRSRADEDSIRAARDEIDPQHPDTVLAWALRRFGRRLAICTSFQAEGMVILDMAWRMDRAVRVFTIDTGRLPAETYELVDRVRAHYGITIDVVYPDAGELADFVSREGLNAFYRSVPLRMACCQVRKVNPLKRALADVDAWVTGVRQGHGYSRAGTDVLEIDHDHGDIVKINPLAVWTEEEVWSYIRGHDVPYNALYDQGYSSIGCAPCTRPPRAGEDARSGRWWWEDNGSKECGIHRPRATCGFESAAE